MIKYKNTKEMKQAHCLSRIRKQHKRKLQGPRASKPYNQDKHEQQMKELHPEVFVYKCDVPIRKEELPPFSKASKAVVVERSFKKEVSVFGKWREDNAGTVGQSFKLDIE